MRLGLVMGIPSPPLTFDPATLSLTGWWQGSFTASPWVGVASAGSSGSHNLSEATNPPASGTAVDTYHPASFDGTNDKLAGAALSSFFSSSAYSMAALINVTSFTGADPGASAPYSCTSLLASGADGASGTQCGGPAGTGASGVFRYGHHDGAWKSDSVAIATSTWVMVKVAFDGSHIKVGKNNTAFGAGTAAGNVSAALTPNLEIGRDGLNTIFINTNVLDAITASTALSGTDFDNYYSYLKARYPSAGLP